MRRFLIATLTALALAFALAGCSALHDLHVKVPRVPEKVHEFNDSNLNNIRKHATHHQFCYDNRGVLTDDCSGQ